MARQLASATTASHDHCQPCLKALPHTGHTTTGGTTSHEFQESLEETELSTYK